MDHGVRGMVRGCLVALRRHKGLERTRGRLSLLCKGRIFRGHSATTAALPFQLLLTFHASPVVAAATSCASSSVGVGSISLWHPLTASVSVYQADYDDDGRDAAWEWKDEPPSVTGKTQPQRTTKGGLRTKRILVNR